MRKRRHGKRRTNGGNKFSKVLVTLLLVAVLGLGFYYFAFDKKTVNELKNKVVNKVTKEEKYSLSLTMVGDYLIHSSVYNDANSLAGYNGYDFKPMITYVKDIVSNYDLAYYNQETILGGSELGLSDYPCFNSPYEAGDAMIDAANCLGFVPKGLASCMAMFEAQSPCPACLGRSRRTSKSSGRVCPRSSATRRTALSSASFSSSVMFCKAITLPL